MSIFDEDSIHSQPQILAGMSIPAPEESIEKLLQKLKESELEDVAGILLRARRQEYFLILSLKVLRTGKQFCDHADNMSFLSDTGWTYMQTVRL